MLFRSRLYEHISTSFRRRFCHIHPSMIEIIGNEEDPEYKLIKWFVNMLYSFLPCSSNGHQEPPTDINCKKIICTSSGLLQHEMNNNENDPIKKDAALYSFLEMINLENSTVEYPFLEEYWLQYYVSISPKMRYGSSPSLWTQFIDSHTDVR